jgi:hypothetical protein
MQFGDGVLPNPNGIGEPPCDSKSVGHPFAVWSALSTVPAPQHHFARSSVKIQAWQFDAQAAVVVAVVVADVALTKVIVPIGNVAPTVSHPVGVLHGEPKAFLPVSAAVNGQLESVVIVELEFSQVT